MLLSPSHTLGKWIILPFCCNPPTLKDWKLSRSESGLWRGGGLTVPYKNCNGAWRPLTKISLRKPQTISMIHNIDWCTWICNPSRTICLSPKQKPLFNADVHTWNRTRYAALKSGDLIEYKHAQDELQKSMRAAERTDTQTSELQQGEHHKRHVAVN